jgi:hypothetical protein
MKGSQVMEQQTTREIFPAYTSGKVFLVYFLFFGRDLLQVF